VAGLAAAREVELVRANRDLLVRGRAARLRAAGTALLVFTIGAEVFSAFTVFRP